MAEVPPDRDRCALRRCCDTARSHQSARAWPQGDDADAQEACKQALYTALEAGLRLLHPFMPFITEELWQRLPRRASDSAKSVMVAPYPEAAWAGAPDVAAEAAMERLQGLVREARDLRTQRGLKPREAADITVACSVRRQRCVLLACVVVSAERHLAGVLPGRRGATKTP